MRFRLMSVGPYIFENEPCNKSGLIGGKVIAVNPETGEEISRNYKKFHNGKTDKFNVMAKMIMELIPPEEEEDDGEDVDESTEND